MYISTPPGIEPRTHWTRGRHATIWAIAVSLLFLCIYPYLDLPSPCPFHNPFHYKTICIAEVWLLLLGVPHFVAITHQKFWICLYSYCMNLHDINILNSCPTQGRVEGWDAMKPLYYRSVSSKGAGRPRLTRHHKGGWNETKWIRWVWRDGGMKFVVGENGRNPVKNLPWPRFIHHDTHMEGPRRELGTPAVGIYMKGCQIYACIIENYSIG